MFVHGPSSHLAQSLGDVDPIQPIPNCWGVPTCLHAPNVLDWRGRETSSRADPHVFGLAAGLARADTWVCPYIQCRHRAPSTKPPAPRVGAAPCVRPLNDQAPLACLSYSVTNRTTPSTSCRFSCPRRSR